MYIDYFDFNSENEAILFLETKRSNGQNAYMLKYNDTAYQVRVEFWAK